MATTVRITETYDLKTTLNKIGLIGVHTPTGQLLNRLYPGLVKNHNFVRFLKCDVTGACASVLPADPLSVGVSAGDVAPEDMFNPILYKAVSNDAFDSIMAKIYDQADAGSLGSVNAGDIGTSSTAFNAYYALLSENGKYRKAMPQSGFRINGLVPICHTLISTYGNTTPIGNFVGYEKLPDDQGSTDAFIPNLSDTPSVANDLSSNPYNSHNAVVFRGRSVRMPKIPLHYTTKGPGVNESSVNIPRTFVLAMIVPPARLHEFYYRMRVTWTIRFEKVVSTLTTTDLPGIYNSASLAYYKSYSSSKAEMENSENMVDTDGVEIKKIMES